MPLFLISFHDIGRDLGGCVLRATTERRALKAVRKAGYAQQVGLPAHGRALITRLLPRLETLVDERFIGHVLTANERDELLDTLEPHGLLRGAASDDAADAMADRLDDEMGASRHKGGAHGEERPN